MYDHTREACTSGSCPHLLVGEGMTRMICVDCRLPDGLEIQHRLEWAELSSNRTGVMAVPCGRCGERDVETTMTVVTGVWAADDGVYPVGSTEWTGVKWVGTCACGLHGRLWKWAYLSCRWCEVTYRAEVITG